MKKNQDLAAFYDRVYAKGEKKHYTKHLFKEGTGLPLDEREVLAAGKWKGKTVLDVGCGTGLIAHEIAKAGAKRVVGIDYSESAIVAAKTEHEHPRLVYLHEELKKHKGVYDVIVSLGTLEHMDKPFTVLTSLKRHLNPGGTIILTCPNWSNPRGYILQTLRFLFDAPITLADLHYFTPIEFEAWAKKLSMRLSWKTFDFERSQGDRLIKDFSRRLPNVLRDMGIIGKDREVKAFVKWVEEHVLTLRHDAPWSGATALYVLKG